MDIPIFRFQSSELESVAMRVVHRIVRSGRFILGNEVDHFENSFAEYLGVKHCVTVGNGTDALQLALQAVGVCFGDLVLTVANAGCYSTAAIRSLGAQPLYVDVKGDSLLFDASLIDDHALKDAKALIATHLYGQIVDIEIIAVLCHKYGIPLIEDCAQSHGAMLGGCYAGSFGDIGCFSFYPTKNLGGIGDGGALVTDSDDIAYRVRQLRQYGWDQKYHVVVAGGRNSRLDEIQAGYLREVLPNLNDSNSRRIEIAEYYNDRFKDLPLMSPKIDGKRHVVHQYVLQVADRDDFRNYLSEAGVMTEIHYPIPDNHQMAYPESAKPSLPVTELACSRVVSLPCFPCLSESECKYVANTVCSYFDR